MKLGDVGTVFWKELQEIGEQFGGSRTQYLAFGMFAVWFGIVLPLRTGAAWLGSPLSGAFYLFMAIMFALQPLADSFAGERERHTLETLLATRLSDDAILAGKLLGALLPACTFALLMFVAGIVATNIRYGHGALILPSGLTVAVILAATTLLPLLFGGIGVIISLRAPTVRRAAQMMSLTMMGLILVLLGAGKVLPREWMRWIGAQLMAHRPGEIIAVVVAGVAVIDLLVLAIARARFRRGSLALD